ncbi:histone acetyltransferase 1 [Blyttiomyces sp. JEL0837]|nr:histone acetyltransferase 1 [Blyttiomyces sp. JEL0837]
MVKSKDRMPGSSDPTPEEKNRTFHPEFTYALFGEDEVLFGYKNPVVRLHYGAGSLTTYLGMTYSSRIDEALLSNGSTTSATESGVSPQDVLPVIAEKMPPGYTDNYNVFMEKVTKEEKTFKPMGEKFHEYTVKGKLDSVYEMYKCTMQTPRFKEYHKKMQLFLLWFIEGASFIDDEDSTWEAVVVFERNVLVPGESEYVYDLVGYCTLYPFFCYPDMKRMRISQFVILPPFQKSGHGSQLYKALYQDFLLNPHVFDFTVEDPNDAFQNMRDRCDVEKILEDKKFSVLKAPVDPDVVAELKKKFKLSKGQADRCCEMVLLKNLKMNDANAYKAYRLHVKRRLFRHNEEVLIPMGKDERLQKLEETYRAVEEGYRDVLGRL